MAGLRLFCAESVQSVRGSIERYEKASKLSNEEFKQVIGVKNETFEVMVKVIEQAYQAKHQRRGRHSKLSTQDMLFMTLKYWRQYVTQLELSIEFEVGEATTHDVMVWVGLWDKTLWNHLHGFPLNMHSFRPNICC
ncbi:MAG: transposase family protein [Nitrososphaerota archaeon]|jgi:hypothetical protein|nr:transposase family protein [Nitrososphaerota archaeon]